MNKLFFNLLIFFSIQNCSAAKGPSNRHLNGRVKHGRGGPHVRKWRKEKKPKRVANRYDKKGDDVAGVCCAFAGMAVMVIVYGYLGMINGR